MFDKDELLFETTIVHEDKNITRADRNLDSFNINTPIYFYVFFMRFYNNIRFNKNFINNLQIVIKHFASINHFRRLN